MTELRTSWSKQTPPYGAFDDYVIIESSGQSERILIRPEEFDYLMNVLFGNWNLKKSKYIQLLKEWNECIGFNDVEEKPSILKDNEDTINAIKELKGVDQLEFAKMTNDDIKLLYDFFVRNRKEELKIWKQ